MKDWCLSLLLLVLLNLALSSAASLATVASFNGTILDGPSWIRVQKYLNDAACGGTGASALIAEDFIRVGDDGNCFTYDPQQSTTMKLPVSFRLWMTDGGSTLVTQNYREKDCITPSGYSKTKVGKCTANAVDNKQWFQLSWFASKPSPVVKGYVQRYYSNVATGAATCSNSALTIERVVQNFGACFTQPNTKGQRMQYSCKRILTSHWDRLSTTAVEAQLCNAPASTYVAKNYLPPALCEPAASYPVASAVFLNAFPQNGTSTMAVTVADFQFAADCTLSYEDAFFLSQMRQLQQNWLIKTASCSLSLLCSLLTVAIILLMKKRNDISNVVLCMSIAQIFYDCSFYSPYPASYQLVTSPAYIMSTYVSQFFSRGFSLVVLLITNIFAVSVVYIVALYKQFDVKSKLPTLVCCSVVLGLVFPLTILLGETSIISADLSTAIVAGKANYKNPIVVCIFLLGLLQVIGIGGNAIACLLVIYHACKVSPGVNASSSLLEVGRPLLEVGKRLSLYPAVQVITQLSAMWFEYVQISKEISDDSYHDERYVVYSYVCSGIVPLAGTLFFLVFLFYHKNAMATVKAELGPRFGCRGKEAQLTGILEAIHRKRDKRGRRGGDDEERGAFFAELRARGVPEEDWDRLFAEHRRKGADLALLREEHPDASEGEIEAMYERQHATLESIVNRARNSQPATGSNDEEEQEDEDEDEEYDEYPAAGGAADGWGGGGQEGGDESRFFEQDGRLRAFTRAEMSQMDDQMLVELAIAEQRFRARTRTQTVEQGPTDQVPAPPARPGSRPVGSVFVSMSQIFTSSHESERVAGEVESSVNPIVHSVRPLTWGPRDASEAAAGASPPPPRPPPPPSPAGLPAPPPPPRPPPPVQTRL